MKALIPINAAQVGIASFGDTPALIAACGAEAETRFWEFFTVTIRNPNTRAAYARAAAEFCAFVEAGRIGGLRALWLVKKPGRAPACSGERSAESNQELPVDGEAGPGRSGARRAAADPGRAPFR